MTDRHAVSPDRLRRTCDPAKFPFETTESLEALQGIIGQPRAVTATEFGLSTDAPGYNIYLSGPAGTGKGTYAATAARERASSAPCPEDWCYLFNFDEPDRPIAVSLPAGEALEFRDHVNELIEDLKEAIPREFEGADFERQRGTIMNRLRDGTAGVLKQLEEAARSQGFGLRRTSTGFTTVPLRDGQPLTPEEFEQLEADERSEIERRSRDLQAQVAETLRKLRTMEKEARQEVRELERDIGLSVAAPLFERLENRYGDHEGIGSYLETARNHVVENLEAFRRDEEDAQARGGTPSDPFAQYRVNVLVSHAGDEGAPVIIENNPTYYNLVGKVEYRSHMGALTTDFTMIKPGALHRANGGYLLLNIRDVVTNPMAWEGLKRALKSRCIAIEDIGEQFRALPTATLKPEPIPLSVKVLLMGSPIHYHLLHAYDEDFRKLFKVRADFDVTMKRTPDHLLLYASLISSLCRREGLRHFTREAVARVVDEGTRLADDQEKLSTRFNEVVEIVYEASAWAGADDAEHVEVEHVNRALEARIYRSNRLEESIQEMIARNKIMVDTSGGVVGQVNGISVYKLGDYAFGKPTRITARTFLGRRGVVNIEREIRMSGRAHSKGVMILSAYLGAMFAQERPLSLSASLTFEQTYEEVDGDSASSAELYALLSSLSGISLNQELAVTGSVNQKGEIQPIGGVNEKIEGFYAVCKEKGLTGSQGVIIPVGNVDNLMLRDEVVEAVRNGDFHVHAISHVDEGIELLTGREAGRPDENGMYPDGTVYAGVSGRLSAMADSMGRHHRRNTGDNGSSDGEDR